MSWDIETRNKVYARLVGDSTLSGLVADMPGTTVAAISTEWPAEGTPMPYVVLNYDTAGTEDAFTAKGIYITLDVHVFHEKKAVGDTQSTCSLILNRIVGDWLTNGGTPSYGLDRFAPELSAVGWTASQFLQSGPRVDEHEAGVWHFVDTYEGFISKQVTGP